MARCLPPHEQQLAELPAGPPILIVSIDTESEFDWNGPFLRTQTSVRNVRYQSMAQEIFDRYGVRPIYLVDYAVATQPEAYLPLREIFQSKRCEIGAHLHPWITPPFLEELGARASFTRTCRRPAKSKAHTANRSHREQLRFPPTRVSRRPIGGRGGNRRYADLSRLSNRHERAAWDRHASHLWPGFSAAGSTGPTGSAATCLCSRYRPRPALPACSPPAPCRKLSH